MNEVSAHVKWYSEIKRYGFLRLADGSDVFVHRSAIEGGLPLVDGEQVAAVIGTAPDGRRCATRVRVLGAKAAQTVTAEARC